MARIISAGNTLFSPENYDRKRRERKRKLVLALVCVLSLFIALVLTSRIDKFLISDIEVYGAKVITEDEVSRSVLSTLSGKFLWLIPKSNVLFIPRGEVEANLMREYPRLSSISLSLSGTKILSASVVEREPYALYCQNSDAEDKCYFLDESGFIFDEAPDFSGVVYFIYRGEGLPEPKGRQFLPHDKFRELSAFVENIDKIGFEPVSHSDAEIIMRNGTKLAWKEGGDLTRIFSNLKLFLESPEIRAQENFINKVRVFDLSTENKVFYRFK